MSPDTQVVESLVQIITREVLGRLRRGGYSEIHLAGLDVQTRLRQRHVRHHLLQ